MPLLLIEGKDPQDEEVQQKIAAIQGALTRGKPWRLEVGKLLYELHKLLSNHGDGTYMAALRNIPIAYNTARNYMNEYCEHIGCNQNGYNSLMVQETHFTVLPPEAPEDPQAQAIAKAKADARRAVNETKNESPLVRLDLRIEQAETRALLRKIHKVLGPQEVARRHVIAILGVQHAN